MFSSAYFGAADEKHYIIQQVNYFIYNIYFANIKNV
jgi:hypothetical protein